MLLAALNKDLESFINEQKVFFVATAPHSGKINLSPKGLDTLRILGPNKIAWLNLTGSGNETAAHIHENRRITLMFCAFNGKPLILRLYGQGTNVHATSPEWEALLGLFPGIPGARQVILIDVEQVQTSCGFGVPLMTYTGERNQLDKWAEDKGPQGVQDYWTKHNQTSLDGLPTGIPAGEQS